MSESQSALVASSCLEAWSTGDFATARSLLREDVTLGSPLGSAVGLEASMKSLMALGQQVRRADHRKVVVDGDDVCIMYDLVTVSAGTVPTSDWYHVAGGKIDAVRAHFDGRGFRATGAGPASGTAAGPPRPPGEATRPQRMLALISAEMELAESNA